MSRELEERLERALEQVRPSTAAGEQARSGAMAALGRSSSRRSGAGFLLPAAALVAMLVTTGVTLAASRTARETLGLASRPRHHHQPPARPAGPLPAGSAGFAAYGSGRLSLAAPGIHIAGRQFSAVELSPGALNMAVGAHRALQVIRLSDGGVAWSHPAGGRVVAAAWAPIGTEIAYVVRRPGGYQLRMIEGDGDHDRLLEPRVAPVTPSWRADSLAIGYVGPDHQVRVYDFRDGRVHRVRRPAGCALITASAVTFAPRGELLAASIGDGNVLVTNTATGWTRCTAPVNALGPMPPAQLAWVAGRSLLAANFQFIARVDVVGRRLVTAGQVSAPGGVNGLTVSPDARRIAVGVGGVQGIRVIEALMPRPGDRLLRDMRLLRELPPPTPGAQGPFSPAWYRLIWR
jgi:hypothetical protein